MSRTTSTCKGCPQRVSCGFFIRWEQPLNCVDIKAQHASRQPPATDKPMSLMEAAELVVRHWDLHQDRGMEAAVDLLRRVIARQ